MITVEFANCFRDFVFVDLVEDSISSRSCSLCYLAVLRVVGGDRAVCRNFAKGGANVGNFGNFKKRQAASGGALEDYV